MERIDVEGLAQVLICSDMLWVGPGRNLMQRAEDLPALYVRVFTQDCGVWHVKSSYGPDFRHSGSPFLEWCLQCLYQS